jgi:hypothetical protein
VLGAALEHAIESGLPLRVVTTAAVTAEARRHVAQRDIVELPAVTGHSGETLGMGFSIASGVAASADAGGWLILPGDMPSLKPATLLAVAAELPQHAVVYAQHIGRRGHPVGFASELYSGSYGWQATKGRAAWWPDIPRSASRSMIPACWSTSIRSTTWRRCTPIRRRAKSTGRALATEARAPGRSFGGGWFAGQTEQRMHRIAHLIADHRLRVVVGAVVGQDEALGLASVVVQRAAERRLNQPILRAMHHQHRRADLGDALAGVEALRDQQLAAASEPHRCEYISTDVKPPSTTTPASSLTSARVDRVRCPTNDRRSAAAAAAAGAATPRRRGRPRRRWLRTAARRCLTEAP